MKSVWKGTIDFGLVNIPVKLFPGAENTILINLW